MTLLYVKVVLRPKNCLLSISFYHVIRGFIDNYGEICFDIL